MDLSVGTPVDPTPDIARQALAEAGNSPGYPLTSGTADLREAIVGYLARRWGAQNLPPTATLPVIGTKELVAWLPTLLGLGPDDLVVYPAVAYPTYAVGATLAGCSAVACDDLEQLGNARPALVWLNSPANPTGAILDPETLTRRVAWARERGALVAADECYGEFGWETEPVSVLHPAVNGGGHDGMLAVHSLSKRSNLAGYRAGFLAGDPGVVAELLEVRKHAGMIVPRPVQRAMIALLGDQQHVVEQRARYLGAGPSSGRRWRRPASGSSTQKGRSISGPPGTMTAGHPSTSWPITGSWSLRARSTDPPRTGTYAWPSPRPTSASPPPPPSCRASGERPLPSEGAMSETRETSKGGLSGR